MDQKTVIIPHKWTEQEKRVNCQACTLASIMRDCKNCPFYTLTNQNQPVIINTDKQKESKCQN